MENGRIFGFPVVTTDAVDPGSVWVIPSTLPVRHPGESDSEWSARAFRDAVVIKGLGDPILWPTR